MPVLVLVGIVLAPTMYYQVWNALHTAPVGQQAKLQELLYHKEDILLLQISAGLLFGTFVAIALSARAQNSGLHKRMMILATAVPLGASIDRMWWLPNTLPGSPWGTDLYILLALSPMFAWDVIRNRGVHEAYRIWLAIYVPVALLVTVLWDKPWWHAAARTIMRV